MSTTAPKNARLVIEHLDALPLSCKEQEGLLKVLSQPPKPPLTKLKKLMAMERLNER